MESDQLYLADEHHATGVCVIGTTRGEIDETVHFLEFALMICGNTYLREAGYGDVV